MKHGKPDRRVTRTKHLLRESLMSLMAEKRYETITVQDILDRADVGRSTFYSHFRDKEELLISGMDDILHSLILILEPSTELIGDKQRIISIEPLFKHAMDEHQLHRAIVGGQGIDFMLRKILNHLAAHVEDQLRKLVPTSRQSKVPLPLVAHHIAAVVLTLLRWWFENNRPQKPKEMDTVFQQLVMPGVWEVLGMETK